MPNQPIHQDIDTQKKPSIAELIDALIGARLGRMWAEFNVFVLR
jgi:hypothetical protein